MATVYPKDKTGILYVSYYNDEGKRKAFALKHPGTGEKLRDIPGDWVIANRLKRELERDIRSNDRFRVWNLKLTTAIEKFKSEKSGLSKKSRDMYGTVTNKIYDFFGNVLIADISESKIDEMVDEWNEKKSHNTVFTYEKYLTFFLKWLYENKYITYRYTQRFKYKPTRIRTIPEEDFEIILDYIKDKHYQMYLFFYTLWLTGRRLGEVHRMRWEDINWKDKTIYIRNQKGHREDQYPLYKSLEEHLEPIRKDIGKIFDYSFDWKQQYWRKSIIALNNEREKKELSPIPLYKIHEIRKTVATNLRAKGVQLEDAADLLGHKDIATTRKYYTAVKLDRLRQELER